MDNPHICFFSHSSFLSGAERSLLDMMTSLTELGVRCSVIMAGDNALKDACEQNGICVKTFPQIAWWCDTEGDSEEVYKTLSTTISECLDDMVDYVRSIAPDAIFTQTIVHPFGAIVAEELHLPHFWALREYGELDHGLRFALGYRNSMDMMFETSQKVFSVSKSVAETILKENANSEKVVINYSNVTIPKQYMSQNKRILQDEIIKIGVFGSVTDGKNQKDIVKASLLLLEKEYPIKLYIVGNIVGNKDLKYLDELKDIIGHSYQKSFVWQENLTDPYPLMNEMDIVVSCAKSEAMGRTLLEAVLLKKAIIYSNVAGFKEIYINGIHGLGYELYDIDDLAKKIIQTIEDRESTYQRVQEAFEYVNHTFTSLAYAQPVLSAINDIKTNPAKRDDKYVTEFVYKKIAAKYGTKTIGLERKIIEQKSLLQMKEDQLLEKEQQMRGKDQQLQQKEQQIQQLLELAESMRIKNRIKRLLKIGKS